MPPSAPPPAPRRTDLEHMLATAEQLASLGSWRVDLRTGAVAWSDEMFRIHGLEPGSVVPSIDLVIDFAHPDDRERVSSVLRGVLAAPHEAPPAGVLDEYRLIRPTGETRTLRFLGRVERDDRGEPSLWVGTAQDVTEQRWVERELRARHELGEALREWETFDQGVVGLLRRIATALDWPVGAIWTFDPADRRFAARAFWYGPEVDAGDFEIVTRSTRFRPGEGVVGRVWQSGEVIAAADLAQHLARPRREAATAAGLHGGVAFPAVADGEVLAVLSFYTVHTFALDDRVLRALTAIGAELGRFFSRRRADLEPRRLTEREVEVLRLAAEGNTGPEIAARLVVSPTTVKSHFEHIYEKLGVGDRAAAVAHALRTGLIQ